ncbi:MAG: hypothetical protein V4616_10230 [Bacteroidota bacterium]
MRIAIAILVFASLNTFGQFDRAPFAGIYERKFGEEGCRSFLRLEPFAECFEVYLIQCDSTVTIISGNCSVDASGRFTLQADTLKLSLIDKTSPVMLSDLLKPYHFYSKISEEEFLLAMQQQLPAIEQQQLFTEAEMNQPKAGTAKKRSVATGSISGRWIGTFRDKPIEFNLKKRGTRYYATMYYNSRWDVYYAEKTAKGFLIRESGNNSWNGNYELEIKRSGEASGQWTSRSGIKSFPVVLKPVL